MKKNSKKITTFNLILIMTLILLTAVGVSYAWFSANLTGDHRVGARAVVSAVVASSSTRY